VADLLRDCIATGEFGPLANAYAPGAGLDASLPGARRTPHGPDAIVELLNGCFAGPGQLVEWTPTIDDGGVAVWLERVGEDGSAARQRHYLHMGDGLIARHWIYAARPHTTEPDPPEAGEGAERLFAGLGRIAERSTLTTGGWSGNRIDRLVMDDGRALIAKRIVPGSDWIGRNTRDPGREALMFADGSFDRFPSDVDHAVVAAEPDGDAWWVVTRDVSAELLDDATPLTREQNRFVLRAAAAMWDEFWDDPPSVAGSQRDRLAMASLEVADRECDGLDILPKQFYAAWDAFAEAVDADVGDAVLDLLAHPERLSAAVEGRGTTLCHGDLRDENMGMGDGTLVLLDWGLATRGHPAVDFAWYMVHDVWRIDATHDEVVEDYRRAMGERDDPLALDLGLISGLVQYGWIFGHSAVVHTDPREREWARRELDWWVPRVRRALDEWR
jgi:hypothetical protein